MTEALFRARTPFFASCSIRTIATRCRSNTDKYGGTAMVRKGLKKINKTENGLKDNQKKDKKHTIKTNLKKQSNNNKETLFDLKMRTVHTSYLALFRYCGKIF